MSIFMMCDKDAPGAVASSGYKDIWLQETFPGAVVSLYERNGYDDSDFMAVVWDEANGRTQDILYGTTRGWTYPNYAVVDASPEVRAKANAYMAEQARQEAAARRFRTIQVGDLVRISLKAGKNKAYNAQEAEVFWVGANPFSLYPESRYGVRFSDGTKLFFGQRNVIKLANAPETV